MISLELNLVRCDRNQLHRHLLDRSIDTVVVDPNEFDPGNSRVVRETVDALPEASRRVMVLPLDAVGPTSGGDSGGQ